MGGRNNRKQSEGRMNSTLQNAGKNKVKQSPDKKDIAQSQLPGRCERARRRKSVISSSAIVEQMFSFVKQISARPVRPQGFLARSINDIAWPPGPFQKIDCHVNPWGLAFNPFVPISGD
jgi:hypothetical protein